MLLSRIVDDIRPWSFHGRALGGAPACLAGSAGGPAPQAEPTPGSPNVMARARGGRGLPTVRRQLRGPQPTDV